MKRIKLLSLVLIATLILSSLNIFAFASEEDPTDPNNPQIMMFYTGTAVIGGKTTINQMTIKARKGTLNGKCDIDGVACELNKNYTATEAKKVENGYYYEGNKLYKFNLIGKSTPGVYDESMNGQTVDVSYTYTYELIPTTEHPKTSSTLTIQHSDSIIQKTVEKYIVNNKETTKDNYNKSKIGSWKEKTSTKYVKDLEKTLTKTEEHFAGVTEKDVEIKWSDGTVEKYKRPVYNFQIDEYYAVTQQYLKTYELTTTPSTVKPQAKPVLKTKVSIKTPSRTKSSITVKWKKLSKANQKKVSKIEVQISKSKNFSSYTAYKVNKKSASKKISKLKRKTKYFVRVRAINGSKVGSWSSVKSVKTK